MSRKSLLCLTTLACLAAALAWQRSVLAGLRTRQDALRAANAEAGRLVAENEEMGNLRAAASRTVDAGSELMRLRNEVRQLRELPPQIERLRAENERLAAAAGTGAAQTHNFAETEGYLARETWSNAGFATPEAAVQSFFWALRERNHAQILACFTQEQGRRLSRVTDANGNVDVQQLESGFRPLAAVPGFRFARVEIREDSARVGLQAAQGGAVIDLHLRTEANEWKLQSF